MNEIISSQKLSEERKEYIASKFSNFIKLVDEWKLKAEKLVVTDDSQKPLMQEARKARLAIRQLRLEADKVREDLKEDSLRYGQAIQSVYNFIESQIKPIEAHLSRQENFTKIRLETERENLRLLRQSEINRYWKFIPRGTVLEDLNETEYNELYQFVIAESEKFEAQEAIRVQKEKEEKEAFLKLQKENRRLQAELEEKKRQEEEEAEAKAQAEFAPEKEKILAFVRLLKSCQEPVLEAEKSIKLMANIKILLNKIETYAIEKTQKL